MKAARAPAGTLQQPNVTSSPPRKGENLTPVPTTDTLVQARGTRRGRPPRPRAACAPAVMPQQPSVTSSSPRRGEALTPVSPNNTLVQGEAPEASTSRKGLGRGTNQGTPPPGEADYAPTVSELQDNVSTKDFVQEEVHQRSPAQELPGEKPAEEDPRQAERTEPGTTPAPGTLSPNQDDIPEEPGPGPRGRRQTSGAHCAS